MGAGSAISPPAEARRPTLGERARALGVDRAAGEQQIHGVDPAHLPREEDGRVAAREEPERHLRPVERRARRAVADVGREQHVGAAGQAGAVDRDDERLPDVVAGEERVGRASERLEDLGRNALAARERGGRGNRLLQVHAGRKRAGGAGYHAAAQRRVVAQAVPGAGQIQDVRRIERVARLGTVDGDDRDGAVDLDADHACRYFALPAAVLLTELSAPTAARFVASTSIVIVTSSPTATPPASSAWFQVRPKSLRLIFVVACAPARVLPHGSFISGVGPSTSRTTGRVTPCRVRSPLTLYRPVPAGSILVETNVIFGYLATSRKSGLRRWLSRFSMCVSMLAGSISASIRERAGSDSLASTVPDTLPNWPRTLLTIR